MFSQHNYNKASMRKIVNSLRLNDIKEKYYSESIKYLNSKLNNSKIGKYENIDSDNIIINKSNQWDNLKTRHKVSKWFKNLLGFETEPNSDLKNRDKFSSKNKEQDECLSSFDPIELDIQSASFTPFATLLGNCHDKPVITVQNLMTTYFDKKRDKATQIQKEIRLQQLQKELELMHNNDDMNNLTETQELNAFHQSEINPDLETALLNEIETSNQIEIGGEGGDMFDYFNEFSGHFTQTYIDQDSESIKSVEDNKSLDADINPVTTALESKTGEDKLLLEGLNKGLLDVVLQERTTAHENIKNSNDKNITKFETEDLQNNINEENQENGNQNKLDTLPENSIHNFVEPDALDWNLNAFDAAINSQHLSKEIFVDDKVYDQLLNDLYQLENKEVRPQSRFSVNSKPRIDYNPYPNIYDHHNENRAYLPHQYYRNQPVLNENDFFKNKNSFRVEIDGFDNLSVASLSLTVSRPVKPLEYTYTNTKINKNHQRNLKNIEPSKLFEFNYNSLKHIPQVEKLEKSLRDCSNRLNHQNYQSGFRKTQNAVHDPVLGFLDENKKNDYDVSRNQTVKRYKKDGDCYKPVDSFVPFKSYNKDGDNETSHSQEVSVVEEFASNKILDQVKKSEKIKKRLGEDRLHDGARFQEDKNPRAQNLSYKRNKSFKVLKPPRLTNKKSQRPYSKIYSQNEIDKLKNSMRRRRRTSYYMKEIV